MRQLILIAACVSLVFSSTLLAHDRKVGVLIDAACGNRLAGSSEDAKVHEVACSLKEACASSGYGVITGGKFYKFDEMGDKLAAVILKASNRKANLRVRVDAHFDVEVISPAILEQIN
ncbi:MAG: hypothetical protein V3R94_07485 [Acidobacteriota bacterium]